MHTFGSHSCLSSLSLSARDCPYSQPALPQTTLPYLSSTFRVLHALMQLPSLFLPGRTSPTHSRFCNNLHASILHTIVHYLDPLAPPPPHSRLCNELHVAVLDAVVHHLHEVARPPGPHVRDARPARAATHLRRHLEQHVLHVRERLPAAARHEGGAVARALLPPTHAHAQVQQALGGGVALAPLSVLVPAE